MRGSRACYLRHLQSQAWVSVAAGDQREGAQAAAGEPLSAASRVVRLSIPRRAVVIADAVADRSVRRDPQARSTKPARAMKSALLLSLGLLCGLATAGECLAVERWRPTAAPAPALGGCKQRRPGSGAAAARACFRAGPPCAYRPDSLHTATLACSFASTAPVLSSADNAAFHTLRPGGGALQHSPCDYCQVRRAA